MIYLNDTVQQTTGLGLTTIKGMNVPNIPSTAQFDNWQHLTNYTEQQLNRMLQNDTFNSTLSGPNGWLLWPVDTNGCYAHFLNSTLGFKASRPDRVIPNTPVLLPPI